MKKPKKRTLNELRQVKEYGYETPKSVNNYKKVNIDPQHIVDLIQSNGNDQDLGAAVRSYYLHLIENKND